MTITLFKQDRKVLCYIRHYENKHIVCTGRPSDITCISWQYDNLQDAEKTAKEYFNNRTNFFKE